MRSETLSRVLMAIAIFSSIIGFALYNWKTFAGDASPNITSWFLWGFVTVLNFTSYKAMSRDWVKSVLPMTNSLLCVFTFFFAFYYGKARALGEYDVAVLLIGIFAAAVWWIFRSSKKANLLIQVAITVAFVPTFISVTAVPSSEIALAWFLWANCFFFHALVVASDWKNEWAELAYPVVGFGLHLAVGVLALV